MKTIKYKIWVAATIIAVFFASDVNAQKRISLEIKVSTQCGMCKEKIEKALAYEKGVRFFNVDYKGQKLFVEYDPRRTSPDKIKQTISKLGYDADEVAADPEAYAKLPGCCKKPDDPEYRKH